MPKSNAHPQPSGLHIEALGSTCRHDTTVANCGTCRPTTGDTR
ncbi:hypothetical protein [Streptosporangium sp. NPDC004631]